MKCPFRLITKHEYATLKNGIVVVDREEEDYPDCYTTECPCWRYELGEGYRCLKLNALEGINLDEE